MAVYFFYAMGAYLNVYYKPDIGSRFAKEQSLMSLFMMFSAFVIYSLF